MRRARRDRRARNNREEEHAHRTHLLNAELQRLYKDPISVHVARGFDVLAKINCRRKRRRNGTGAISQREEQDGEPQESAGRLAGAAARRRDRRARKREDVAVPHEEQMHETDDQEENESAQDVAKPSMRSRCASRPMPKRSEKRITALNSSPSDTARAHASSGPWGAPGTAIAEDGDEDRSRRRTGRHLEARRAPRHGQQVRRGWTPREPTAIEVP